MFPWEILRAISFIVIFGAFCHFLARNFPEGVIISLGLVPKMLEQSPVFQFQAIFDSGKTVS